jgi:aconitate hydratase
MYLGVRAVIAKSFSRIHQANLINWGLIPMVFATPADYDRVAQDDALEIAGVREGILQGARTLTVRNTTKGASFTVRVDATPRERGYLVAGGRLAHVKQHPIK